MRFQEKLPKIHKEKVRFISASSPYVLLQINTIHTYSRMVYSNNLPKFTQERYTCRSLRQGGELKS